MPTPKKDSRQRNLEQRHDPRSDRYRLYDRDSGECIGAKPSPGPYVGVRLPDGTIPTNEPPAEPVPEPEPPETEEAT